MSPQDDAYFEFDRPEVRALVPAEARRVLDVGCGAGALGAALRERARMRGRRAGAFARGRRPRPRRASTPSLEVDLDQLEELPAAAGSFDAMVFGDVLEHLRDPQRLLAALLPSLADGGALVFSIPNVGHWSVVCPLLVNDQLGVHRRRPARPHARPLLHAHRVRATLLVRPRRSRRPRHRRHDHLPLPDRCGRFVDLAVGSAPTRGRRRSARRLPVPDRRPPGGDCLDATQSHLPLAQGPAKDFSQVPPKPADDRVERGVTWSCPGTDKTNDPRRAIDMSLRIQNNVEAFNAHRNLAATERQGSPSRWSGCRPATASTVPPTTPPASRSASSCAAQIGGLDQAQRNVQDARLARADR